MKTRLMTILARTPVHVGAGSSVGAIDMPVQRERHTQIPIIPGSGLKGVLRDLWTRGEEEQRTLFGPESTESEHVAGSLVVGEARTLCFPVRSAKGSFAWITAPLALQRFARERGEKVNIPQIEDNQCLSGSGVTIGEQVVLEEYTFTAAAVPPGIIDLLAGVLPDDPIWSSMADRLAVVSDGIFSHFCANACEVQQRIRIDDDTGTVAKGGLFNQENVPSETVLYAVLGERNGNALQRLEAKIAETGNVLQVGGDETVGLGYCTVTMIGGNS